MTTKKVKKSVKKAEPADTSKKIDELLTKAKCAVPGAENRPSGLKVRCPAWMEEYAARHPNVDFSRCPLDFWRGANNFLFKSFFRAYEECDGDLLKNPAIAEALCVIINEPRALARKFFYRYTESPQLYGGDYDGDLRRITDDWRYYCGYPDPFTGYADWFNLVFQDTGQTSHFGSFSRRSLIQPPFSVRSSPKSRRVISGKACLSSRIPLVLSGRERTSNRRNSRCSARDSLHAHIRRCANCCRSPGWKAARISKEEAIIVLESGLRSG